MVDHFVFMCSTVLRYVIFVSLLLPLFLNFYYANSLNRNPVGPHDVQGWVCKLVQNAQSLYFGFFIFRSSKNSSHSTVQLIYILFHIFFFFISRAHGQCHRCTAAIRGLLYSPYSPRVFGRSHVRRQMPPRPPTTREILIAKGGTMWARINRKFCLRLRLPPQFRDLLHAANL